MALAVLLSLAASARDAGQWNGVDPETRRWFDSLQSKKGYCCSVADGQEVVDYEIKDGHYWAPLDGKWRQVPDEAVIHEPNKVGRAIEWLIQGKGGLEWRCFLPAGGV